MLIEFWAQFIFQVFMYSNFTRKSLNFFKNDFQQIVVAC